MRIMLALSLIGISMLYGYSLAVQPSYATADIRRFAAWTERQSKLVRCVFAFLVWLVFMTGIRLFATRGS